MRIAFVTHRGLPQLSNDDRLAVVELRQHGIEVESAVWDSPLVDWATYDALILRSAWDYHRRADEFEAWLARMDHEGIPMWNPTSLVRWNMDKRYLLDLAERGLPVISTLVVDRGAPASLEAIMGETGWSDVVYKPAVAASGFGVVRAGIEALDTHENGFAAQVAERDTVVQPFVREIETDGEWSLVFMSGQYSHAVRKRARTGDFRVQSDYGGETVAESPRGILIAQAEAVVSHIPGSWLYARVDGCEVDGALLLMELELVEPELFLAYHPSAPRRFAASIRRLLVGRRTPLSFTPRSSTPPGGVAQ